MCPPPTWAPCAHISLLSPCRSLCIQQTSYETDKVTHTWSREYYQISRPAAFLRDSRIVKSRAQHPFPTSGKRDGRTDCLDNPCRAENNSKSYLARWLVSKYLLTTLPKSTHEQSESLHGSAQIYWRSQVQLVAPWAEVDRTGEGGWPQSKPLEYKVSKAENTVVDHKLNHIRTKWAKPKCWPQSEPHDTRSTSTSRHPTEHCRTTLISTFSFLWPRILRWLLHEMKTRL